jgi:hypothetical protein
MEALVSLWLLNAFAGVAQAVRIGNNDSHGVPTVTGLCWPVGVMVLLTCGLGWWAPLLYLLCHAVVPRVLLTADTYHAAAVVYARWACMLISTISLSLSTTTHCRTTHAVRAVLQSYFAGAGSHGMLMWHLTVGCVLLPSQWLYG